MRYRAFGLTPQSCQVFQLVSTAGWSTQGWDPETQCSQSWALMDGTAFCKRIPNNLPAAFDNCAHLNQQIGKQQ